jgi:hypothetical protein
MNRDVRQIVILIFWVTHDNRTTQDSFSGAATGSVLNPPHERRRIAEITP